MKNWLLKKKYRLLPFLICFCLFFFKPLLAPEDAKEAESVAASQAPQVPAMSFSQGPNFQVPDSSVTVLNLQRRRRGPAGSTVITQAPDVIDETKTGSSPGVVAGAALGAGVLGAAAGAGAALAAMTAKANAAQAALDQANTDLDNEKKRAAAIQAELNTRPQIKDLTDANQARTDAIAARDQALATLATRDQEVATLQAQAQQCQDENGRLTAQITQLNEENAGQKQQILVITQQLTAAQEQLKHSSKPPQDSELPSPSPQPPSPSAPPHQIDQSAIHDSVSVISVPDVENSQLQQDYSDLNSQYQALYNVAQNLEAKNQELAQQLAAQQQGQNGQNSELVTQLQNCLETNNQLRQQVQEMSQAVAGLHNQMKAIAYENNQLQTQNSQLVGENQRLQSLLDQTTQQSRSYFDQLQQCIDTNNPLAHERDQLKLRVSDLEQFLSQQGGLQGALDEANARIRVLEKENEDLRNEAIVKINQITQERSYLASQLQQLQTRFDALQAENANYAVQIAKAQQDAADQKISYEKIIQARLDEIARLTAQISTLETQIASFGDPTAKDAQIKQLTDTLKAREDEIAALKVALQKKIDDLQDCQTSAANLQAQLEQVKALVDALKREKLDLETENKQLRDSLDQAGQELAAEKRQSQLKLTDLRAQLADLQQQLDDCTTRNIALEARLRRLLSRISDSMPLGFDSNISLDGSHYSSPHRPSSSHLGGGGYSAPQSFNSRPQGSSSPSQTVSSPVVINFGSGSIPSFSQSTQTHDQVDPSASIISASDSIITETRPNVPPPAPTSRPQSQSSYNQTEDFPEEYNPGGGGGAGSSHFTRPEASLVISEIHPPAPAPSAKKKGALQSDVSRIAQGPTTADLLGLSPIQGETERFQKDASSASSLMQASGRPR